MKILAAKFATASFKENAYPVDIKEHKYISGHYSCSFSCSLISGSDLPTNKKLVECCDGPYGYLLYFDDGSIYHISEKVEWICDEDSRC